MKNLVNFFHISLIKFSGVFLYYYLVFVIKTSKVSVISKSNLDILMSHPFDAGTIVCAWHQRLLALPFLISYLRKKEDYAKRIRLSALRSGHKTTAFMIYLSKKFRVRQIHTAKNNLKTMKSIIKSLKENYDFFILPDGGRGPARRINSAIIDIAKMTKTDMLAMSYSCSNAIYLNTWDRFMIPLPFSRIYITISKPIKFVKDDVNTERSEKALLKKVIDDITKISDNCVNRIKRAR